MMATGGAAALSRSVKSRPREIGMRRAAEIPRSGGVVRGAGLIADRHRRLAQLHERENVIVARQRENLRRAGGRSRRAGNVSAPARAGRRPPALRRLYIWRPADWCGKSACRAGRIRDPSIAGDKSCASAGRPRRAAPAPAPPRPPPGQSAGGCGGTQWRCRVRRRAARPSGPSSPCGWPARARRESR